mmetsp:Transcript_49859/g.143226  ORF Transcript_49859/g.143226 Transcript_49859/m.143226 type:complete len:95 (+) Transcript_49859:610-894(+)
MGLCPRHVLVREEDEEHIWQALNELPYKIRPRLKPNTLQVTIPTGSDLSLFADSGTYDDGLDDIDWDWLEITKHTFIDIPEKNSERSEGAKTWP